MPGGHDLYQHGPATRGALDSIDGNGTDFRQEQLPLTNLIFSGRNRRSVRNLNHRCVSGDALVRNSVQELLMSDTAEMT
jgi:hypothetical protein